MHQYKSTMPSHSSLKHPVRPSSNLFQFTMNFIIHAKENLYTSRGLFCNDLAWLTKLIWENMYKGLKISFKWFFCANWIESSYQHWDTIQYFHIKPAMAQTQIRYHILIVGHYFSQHWFRFNFSFLPRVVNALPNYSFYTSWRKITNSDLVCSELNQLN